MNRLNRLLYALMKRLSALACRLGPDRAIAAGQTFADAVWSLYRLTPYRDFVAANIRAAYPTWTRAEANRLGHAHLRQLVRCIVELMRFPVLDDRTLHDLVDWEGREHLEAALARGKGIIIVSAHFGNWELMGAALSRVAPMMVLVQPPSQGAFDRLFLEYRTMGGAQTYANTGAVSLRPALRALKRNEIVGLLSDQHGEAQEAYGTLFGHPVSVPMGAFYLAQKTGAAVLPSFMVRQEGHRHRLVLEPELDVTGTESDARAWCERLEARIRANPDHWLWVHDRWAREHELRLSERQEALV